MYVNLLDNLGRVTESQSRVVVRRIGGTTYYQWRRSLGDAERSRAGHVDAH